MSVMEQNKINLNFGEYEKEDVGIPVPTSVTMLVSLFLILITFFIVINRSADYDKDKKDIILKSMNNKFGMPTEEAINFGDLIPPRMENFVLELEQLFATNAQIKSSVSGDETIIRSTKSFFYFSDESAFRQDRMEILIKLQDILTRWNKNAKLKITFTLGLDDYDLDKQRLENFRRIMSQPDIDVGLDTTTGDKLTIIIQYD